MKKIIIIGSTGSIGTQALEIIRNNRDLFEVVGLAAGRNIELLKRQIDEFKPKYASALLPFQSDSTIVLSNAEEIIDNVQADIILLAMVGVEGLSVANKAVSKGVRIALANKETLVAAGDIIMSKAKEYGSEIIPVDSEHSAIFQCLLGGKRSELKRIHLTASGGAFRNLTIEQLRHARAVEALKHPVWNMGTKVTIDSATLMNKGLEIVEAVHLFNVNADRINVIVHPESIIHSMVEFIDNTIIANLSNPDMRIPIQYAFTYPVRINGLVKELDLVKLSSLNFKEPDYLRFPSLKIAQACAEKKGTAPLIMNAANEASVELYLKECIGFYDMPALINKALDKYSGLTANTIEDIISIDRRVKEYILSLNNS